MNRSLYYPMGRNADMDAGGAADLQTDIMRFMAILSLCLVAIFALVQSLPLNRVVPVTPTESLTEPAVVKPEKGSDPISEMGSDPFSTPQPTTVREPVTAQPQPAEVVEEATPVREITWRDLIRKPAPVADKTPPESTQAPVPPAPPPEPAARELAEAPVPPDTPPAPAPSTPQPVAEEPLATSRELASEVVPVEEATEAPADVPAREGFTLRFESDTALTRLVARNEVGLYAIGQERSLRMSVNRGAVTFWPASAPNQFHEMDPGTVPNEVVTALRRSGTLGPDLGPDPAGSGPELKWGVTLPVRMRQQLDGYLTEHSSGALVIEGGGNLRLEP